MAGFDPGMTSNEVGVAVAATSPSASPFVVDASAGTSKFGTATSIRDLIDPITRTLLAFGNLIAANSLSAPWHPTIDLAFARVSLSACALAALAACGTSHFIGIHRHVISLLVTVFEHPSRCSIRNTKSQHDPNDDIHQPVAACKNCSSSAFCSLSACCCSSRAACRSACLWACCFAWSSYSRLAPLNLVEQAYAMPNLSFFYPFWVPQLDGERFVALRSALISINFLNLAEANPNAARWRSSARCFAVCAEWAARAFATKLEACPDWVGIAVQTV